MASRVDSFLQVVQVLLAVRPLQQEQGLLKGQRLLVVRPQQQAFPLLRLLLRESLLLSLCA
jgi:hypothetical protein